MAAAAPPGGLWMAGGSARLRHQNISEFIRAKTQEGLRSVLIDAVVDAADELELQRQKILLGYVE